MRKSNEKLENIEETELVSYLQERLAATKQKLVQVAPQCANVLNVMHPAKYVYDVYDHFEFILSRL